MAGSFSLLSSALSALQSSRLIMETANHNVANANTPGYSRQEVYLTSAPPYTLPAYNMPTTPGQIGRGVQVLSIKSAKLESYIRHYRDESNKLSTLSTAYEYAKDIEGLFSEANGSGINSLFSKFISDLKFLSSQPNSIAQREVVLNSANNFVNKVKDVYTQLDRLTFKIDDNVEESVVKVNKIIKDIANLNKQIIAVRSSGNNANDLEDKRDVLYKQLSELINVKVVKKNNGSSYAFVKGKYIIMDDSYKELKTIIDINNHKQVVWADNSPLDITSGKIYSLLQYRDRVIGNINTPSTYMYRLNNYIMSFVNEFNNRHSLGYDLDGNTGINFFSGTDIRDLQVAINSPRLVAASVSHVKSLQNVNRTNKFVDISIPLNQLAADSTFLINPSANGVITINGVNIAWNSNQSLAEIIDNINSSSAGVVASFDNDSQSIILKRNTKLNQGSGANINISDSAGNFTQFMFLAGSPNYVPDTDNSNLYNLKDLQEDALLSLGNISVKDYYDNIISDVGKDSGFKKIEKESQEQILKQVEGQLQQLVGVNLNEEAVKITKAQYAYQAALRLTSIFDDIMNRTINQLGVS